MAELVYKNIISDLKEKIFAGKFTDMKLPDERSLAEQYNVSRSSVKRALNKMSNEGIIKESNGNSAYSWSRCGGRDWPCRSGAGL